MALEVDLAVACFLLEDFFLAEMALEVDLAMACFRLEDFFLVELVGIFL